MTITQEQFIQFSRIYNTLLTIETKGENTLIMADCVRALQTIIQEIQQNTLASQTIEAEKVED